jgi:O-succinylbenzoic acid--CoA ligase
MTRSLAVIPADDVAGVLRALEQRLAGSGPAVLAAASASSTPVPATVGQRIALVVETSGSTGRPKRVALSADAVLASAAASDSALGGPGQWLLALPATYIAGLNVLVRSIVAGTTPVLMRPGHFDADAFLAASSRLSEPLRFTSLVPAQLLRLLESDAATDALRRFDRVLVGGQATPPSLVERARELGIHLTRTYGSSETSGGCVYDGSPIGTTEIGVVDGEIELSGPVLADGYLADPARTERAFVLRSGRRWYRTGDAGSVVDGVLRVTGRLDDTIISGGLKVPLGEVESIVRDLPGFESAVVVGATSAEWGEVPVVVTDSPRAGADAAAALAEVRAVVADRLGRAAAPARIITVDRLPLTASGKPDRLALRSAVDR